MTCWRRLHEWQLLGVRDLIHYALLDWLARDDQIDWSRAIVAVSRRLRVRYDKRADIHQAFLSLGCALICWRSLRRTWRTAA